MSPVRRGSPLGQLAAFARAEEREAEPAPEPLAAGSIDRFVAAAMGEIARPPVERGPAADEPDRGDGATAADEPRAGGDRLLADDVPEPAGLDDGADAPPSSVDGAATHAPVVQPGASRPTAAPAPAAPARSSARVYAWATALALAACLALWLIPRRGGALPPFDMTLAGGVADTRGAEPAPDAPLVLGPGSRLVVTLRPATRVEGAVAARAFLVRGELRVPLALDVTTFRASVRLTGALADPTIAPGAAELVVLVGRAGESLDDTHRADGDEVRVLRRSVRIEVGDR